MVSFSCQHRFGLTHVWSTNRGPISSLHNQVCSQASLKLYSLCSSPLIQVSIADDNRTLQYGPVDYRDHLLSFICTALSVDRENSFVSPPATVQVSGK